MAHFMYETDPQQAPKPSGANLMYESDPQQTPKPSGANLMYEADANQNTTQPAGHSGAHKLYETDPAEQQKPVASGAHRLYETNPADQQKPAASGAHRLYETNPKESRKQATSGAHRLYETDPKEEQRKPANMGAYLLYEESPKPMPKESPRDLPGYVALPPITAQPEPEPDPGVVIYTRGKGGNLNREITVGMQGTTVVNRERLEPLPKFFEKSIPVHCPECLYKGTSVTKKRPGCAVITNMLFLCAIGLVCIFFLPICLPGRTYDTYHYCQKCDAKLGKFTKKLCYTPEEYEELQDNS